MRGLFSKVASICLIALVLFLGMQSQVSASTQDGDFEYTVSNGQATLVYYSGSASAVNIPDSLGGCPVTKIGDASFQNNKNVTDITMPDSVTTIGECAFRECSNLHNVTLSSNLLSIGKMAFYMCWYLNDVTLPQTLKTIGDQAFLECVTIRQVVIPNSVITIGSGAFYRCESLTDLSLSNGMTGIADQTFSLCFHLQTIHIPGNVSTIGQSAFSNCNALASVIIDEGVTSIGIDVFRNCASLSSVSLPNSITSIGANAFDGSQITTLCLPSSLNQMGVGAFANCIKLNNLIVPEGVSAIGEQAFQYCSSLETVVLPTTLQSVGPACFASCTKLRCVYFRGPMVALTTSEFGSTAPNFQIRFNVDNVASWQTAQYWGYWLARGAIVCDVVFDHGYQNKKEEQTVILNSNASQPAGTQREGYTFSGWYSNPSSGLAWSFAQNPVVGNMTLYAHWSANQYTISYDTQGGDVISSQKQVQFDQPYGSLPTPIHAGFEFSGWYTQPNGAGERITEETIEKIAGAHTLYASWNPILYHVTFDTCGGSTIDPITVSYNSTITRPVEPALVGYTFMDWYSDAEYHTVWDFNSDKVLQDIKLFVKWKPIDYTISFNATGGSVTPATVIRPYHGTYGSLPFPVRKGYSFIDWFLDANDPSSAIHSTSIVARANNHILYAKWMANTYVVDFNTLGGTATDSIPTKYDTTVTAPKDPKKTGYSFTGWYEDIDCSKPWDFVSRRITTDLTLYAGWKADLHTVTIRLLDGSDAIVYSVGYNSTVNKPADPSRTGYIFGGWYSDPGLTNSCNFPIVVTSDISIFAKWTICRYTICYDGCNGSNVSSDTVDHGSKLTAPDDPTRPGYTFAGWYKDSGCTAPWSFSYDTVTGDTTLYARWDLNSYTVSFDSQGGSAIAGIAVSHGSTISSPATPIRLNFTFSGWFQDAACTVPWNFGTVTVTQDTTLYAGWVAQTPSNSLRNIALSAGGFNRPFSSAVTSYTVNLGENESAVTITPIKNYDIAAMTIDGKAMGTKTIALANGKTASVTIKVMLGKKSTTYKLKVQRAKSTANTLAALTATAGTWNQPFEPAVTSYTLMVPQNVSKVTLNAARASGLSTVSPAKANFTLKNGKTVRATFKVKAQSGATRTYTVFITRN